MSSTLIYENQRLTQRVKELEEENHKLKLQLGAINHMANYMGQIIDDNVEQQSLPRKFDAKQK